MSSNRDKQESRPSRAAAGSALARQLVRFEWCRRCGGTGLVDPPWFFFWLFDRPCPECEGAGETEVYEEALKTEFFDAEGMVKGARFVLRDGSTIDYGECPLNNHAETRHE